MDEKNMIRAASRLGSGMLFVWLCAHVSCTPASMDRLSPNGAQDYRRFVAMTFPLVIDDPLRYYDRVTGRRVAAPPAIPSGSLWTAVHCPARAGQDTPARFGFIDRVGNWVIAPRFTRAKSFRDGRGVVGTEKGLGVIDDAGRWIVEPGRYDDIWGYTNGRAPFRLGKKWGFLGLYGKVVIAPSYKLPCWFSEGLAVVLDDRGWHCIDTAGKSKFRLAAEPQGKQFRNGLLLVNEQTLTGGASDLTTGGDPCKYGYLSTTGKVAIPLRFEIAESFFEGLAIVGRFADTSGERSQDENASDQEGAEDDRCDDGYSGWGERVCGAIDTKGRLAIPMVYDDLHGFVDGLCAFRRGPKWGYLDRKGREVIPARFDEAGSFRDGLAAVAIDSEVTFVDMTGRIVIRTGEEWVKF